MMATIPQGALRGDVPRLQATIRDGMVNINFNLIWDPIGPVREFQPDWNGPPPDTWLTFADAVALVYSRAWEQWAKSWFYPGNPMPFAGPGDYVSEKVRLSQGQVFYPWQVQAPYAGKWVLPMTNSVYPAYGDSPDQPLGSIQDLRDRLNGQIPSSLKDADRSGVAFRHGRLGQIVAQVANSQANTFIVWNLLDETCSGVMGWRLRGDGHTQGPSGPPVYTAKGSLIGDPGAIDGTSYHPFVDFNCQ
jgi:hypothetical protein